MKSCATGCARAQSPPYIEQECLRELPALDQALMLLRVEQEALDCFRKAGRIASECREWAKDNIRPGVSIRSVLEKIEEKIRAQGAEPGFPAQSSRNQVAAHYCSSPDDE